MKPREPFFGSRRIRVGGPKQAAYHLAGAPPSERLPGARAASSPQPSRSAQEE